MRPVIETEASFPIRRLAHSAKHGTGGWLCGFGPRECDLILHRKDLALAWVIQNATLLQRYCAGRRDIDELCCKPPPSFAVVLSVTMLEWLLFASFSTLCCDTC